MNYACRLRSNRPLLHDSLFRVTAAVDVHHAEHFVAGFEPRGLGAALLHDSGKVPAQCVWETVVLHSRVLDRPDLEVDRIDARGTHGDQHLTGVRKGGVRFVGLKDFLSTEAMDTHLRDRCHERPPWIVNQLRSDIVVPKDGNQCGGSLFLWKAGKREKSNGKRNSTSEANYGAGHA